MANNSGVLRPILSTYVMWSAGRTGGVLPPTPAATRHVLTTMSERTSPEPEAAWRHRENSILSRYPQRNPTGGYIQPPYTDTHTRRAGLSGLKVGHSSMVILDSIEAEKTHHLEVLRHVLPT